LASLPCFATTNRYLGKQEGHSPRGGLLLTAANAATCFTIVPLEGFATRPVVEAETSHPQDQFRRRFLQ
jgi:hypothetical protein